MADARIVLPPAVRRGEAFEVRVQVRHAMETGYRADEFGRAIPRNVIRTLTVRYGGDVVFLARTSSGIAANPYFRFLVVARDAGEIVVDWIDDAGVRGEARASVVVS